MSYLNDGDDRNMYGCTPCPKCKEPYRYQRASEPHIVRCDDCGYQEPATPANAQVDL